MTSYVRDIRLNAAEFYQLKSYAEAEIAENPIRAKNWIAILELAADGFDCDSGVFQFTVDDYQLDYLSMVLGSEIRFRGEAQMVSTSAFCADSYNCSTLAKEITSEAVERFWNIYGHLELNNQPLDETDVVSTGMFSDKEIKYLISEGLVLSGDAKDHV